MKKYISIFLICIALISCKNEEKEVEIEDLELAEKVARASGFESWDDVEQVKFTFNVDRNGETVATRNWDWNPQSGQVILKARDTAITYNRNQELDSLTTGYDRSFVNDVYWLVPQFKLVWDEGTQISYPENDRAQMVRIKYTGNDGYTPGDQYDMMIDGELMITRWKYYPKGTTEPAMETSFENYQDYNGIKIATDHKTPDGSTNIYFTDIEIIKG